MITLELPVPPSVNHIWVHSRRGHYLDPKYKAWLTQFNAACLGAAVPPIPGPVSITIEVIPGSGFRRGRDLDNLIKAPQDAAVRAGLIGGDDAATVQSVTVRLVRPDGGDGRIRLTITPIQATDVIDLAEGRKRPAAARRNKKKDLDLFDQKGQVNPCLLRSLGKARRGTRRLA